jgi:phage head maturation protease
MSSSWSLCDLHKDAPHATHRPVIARTGASLALVEAAGIQDAGQSAGTLEGVFARFNEWVEINDASGHYMERIASGAFRKTIAESGARVPVLLDHGKNSVLGSLPIGRLQSINETPDGANYTVKLNPGLPELLLAGLKDQQFGSSFRAQAIQSRVNRRPSRSRSNPLQLPEVERVELRLLDLGPTSQPAYPTTSAKVRSLVDEAPVEPEAKSKSSWFLGDLKDEDAEPRWLLNRRGKHGRTYACCN